MSVYDRRWLSVAEEAEARWGDGAPRRDAEFIALLEAIRPRLRAWVLARVRPTDRIDADDVLADTIAQAWRAWPRFEDLGPRPFASWVFRILANVLCDHQRRLELRQRKTPAVFGDPFAAACEIPDVFDLADAVTTATTAAEVVAFLQTLGRQGRALTLFAHGATYDDVAATLGYTRAAVKSAIWRARLAVQKQYGGVDALLYGAPATARPNAQ